MRTHLVARLGLSLVAIFAAATAAAVTCGPEVFIAAAEYPVTSFNPYQIVVADFNGDGLADIATFGAYYDLATLSILLGNPDGSFQPAQTITAVDDGIAMTGGLFDAGGTVDLAVSLYDGNVAILPGNGDGTFQTPIVSSFVQPTSGLWALASGDFNGDGDLDLAGVSGGGAASILLGNGDGTFQQPSVFSTGTPVSSLSIGDVDGDGALDVAAGGSGNAVAILLGDGNGGLGPPALAVAGNTLYDVHLADLDGDGHLDVALACATYAGVLLGNGDGTFQAARKFPGGPAPRFVGVADLDADGVPDLAVGNVPSQGPAAIRVLIGQGDGNFVQGLTYGTSNLTALAVAVFGSDGVADIAAAGGYQNIVSVLEGNGDGTLQAIRTEALGFYPRTLAQGDFDGDGLTDLAAVGDSLRILLATASGGFTFGQSLPVSNYGSPVGAGDLNGDGRFDLIVNDYYGTHFFAGNGDGTFQDSVVIPGPSYGASAISLADFNQDGKLDFALLGESGDLYQQIAIYLGNGNGTFQAPLYSASSSRPGSAIVADLDADGIPDVATSESPDCCSGSNTATVLLGRGDGTFDPPAYYATGQGPSGIATADFNDDGTPDLATANNDSTVSLFFGNGDGTFQDQLLVGIGSRPRSIVAADFDGDGIADIVTANRESASATLLRGIGNGGFQGPVTYSVGAEPISMLVVDLLANGIPDIVIGNTSGLGGVSLLVNARLGVAPLPDAGACVGRVGTLRAFAAGLGPLTYQWRKGGVDLVDGGNITGATTATLTIDPASPADNGSYDVVVTTACATVTSNAASFTVTDPPAQPVITVTSPAAPGVAGTALVVGTAGHTYAWTIAGAAIVSGQGTSTIQFLNDVPGTATLQVTEYAVPGCGTSSAILGAPIDFFDVPSSHPFHADIVTVAQSGITAGCGGGNYCPATDVTRAQMAVFLLKARYGADHQPPQFGPIFNDVPNGSFASYWINELWQLSVTTGCGNGNYCPDASVTRAQMAVFLLRTNGVFFPPAATGIFGDVPIGSFAADFIEALYNQGITGGCQASPLLYCPDNPVLRQQMATFLVRTFGL